MRYYPVFLDLAGQQAVVLGDGELAREKAAGLREAGALVRVITDYRRGDIRGARIVVDASGDPEINRASWEEAEAAGILINVVDVPDRCRFIAPAIVRRDPLVIAISTSGESPFLASHLRARLERWLGREWGPFTALVGRVRSRLRERGVPLAEQTRVYRRLLNSELRDLLRAGRDAEAGRLVAVLERPRHGRVALVGAGPGDPALLTAKALDLLASADHVLHDALISPETLALCGPGAHLEDVGKRAGLENPAQESINQRLVELARAGHQVVRLKGGDPFVFGRGGEELRALVDAEVDVVVVPGVSAALAAPAAARIPLTMRGVSSSIAITTAQTGEGLRRLAALAGAAETTVVMMSRAALAEIAATLIPVLGADRPAAVIASATLADEVSVTATLAGIAKAADDAGLGTPATLVVGDVVTAIPAQSIAEATAAIQFG